MQTHLSRLYFLSRGCKQCPIDMTGGKPLWANGDEGYFLSARGTKIKPNHSKANRTPGLKCRNARRASEGNETGIQCRDNTKKCNKER